MSDEVLYPPIAKDRGAGYWMRPKNLWASRYKLRSDHSIEWRTNFEAIAGPPSQDRVAPFSRLLARSPEAGFRFHILGDTGEGDRSQYGLLPLIRARKPDFMLIVGDVVYPAGNETDYKEGFFEPYRDLGIPIWAVPGNHEYYSSNRGREFFNVFCNGEERAEWENHGLQYVPQPGAYWELSEPGVPVTVLGIDSGMTGRLDGGFMKKGDSEQHRWLLDRLIKAEADGRKVIALFHIPALANRKHYSKRKYRLQTVHRLLTGFDCVRLVVCGHWHNYQRYHSDDLARFAVDKCKATSPRPGRPEYIISGGGGAYLHDTAFSHRDTDPPEVYPTPAQLASIAGAGERAVAGALRSMRATKSGIAAIIARFKKSIRRDGDAARFLSLLEVDVSMNGVRVTPLFMDDVKPLFERLPALVTDPHAPLKQTEVENCLQDSFQL